MRARRSAPLRRIGPADGFHERLGLDAADPNSRSTSLRAQVPTRERLTSARSWKSSPSYATGLPMLETSFEPFGNRFFEPTPFPARLPETLASVLRSAVFLAGENGSFFTH